MAENLQATPSANRLHIGVFGKTNSGKSSLINALCGQQVSIVADVPGTTTDPVMKAMELSPLGPCVFMDTAGFGDESKLGAARMEKTKQAAKKADLALLLMTKEGLADELFWYETLKEQGCPVLFVVNKEELCEDKAAFAGVLKERTGKTPLFVSAKNGTGLESLKEALARAVPESFGERRILGELVKTNDLVLLVMPQDIQAPKGRLILPQVQTLRELLDRKCITMCVTTDRLEAALSSLAAPPKLIVTDSQVFSYVYEKKPKESLLTSFSVLFAAYKGDLPYYMEGAKLLQSLTEQSKVLIAECCTHAPLAEDIGRVQLPRVLRKRIGEGLTVDIVSGTDFPADLRGYDLVIQCGACMFNRTYVMSRIQQARAQSVPMTNYGVAIAALAGILDKITTTT